MPSSSWLLPHGRGYGHGRENQEGARLGGKVSGWDLLAVQRRRAGSRGSRRGLPACSHAATSNRLRPVPLTMPRRHAGQWPGARLGEAAAAHGWWWSTVLPTQASGKAGVAGDEEPRAVHEVSRRRRQRRLR
jgi:hypothetical protein